MTTVQKTTSLAAAVLTAIAVAVLFIHSHKEAQMLRNTNDGLVHQVAQLQSDNGHLADENHLLKETPEAYFQRGVDSKAAGQLSAAKEQFDAIVAKFPLSPLAVRASQESTELENVLAKQEADARAEAAEQERQRQLQSAREGESADFNAIFSTAKSVGLDIGKRYYLSADVNQDLEICPTGSLCHDRYIRTESDFDDIAQYKQFLLSFHGETEQCVVTISGGSDNRVHIHQLRC